MEAVLLQNDESLTERTFQMINQMNTSYKYDFSFSCNNRGSLLLPFPSPSLHVADDTLLLLSRQVRAIQARLAAEGVDGTAQELKSIDRGHIGAISPISLHVTGELVQERSHAQIEEEENETDDEAEHECAICMDDFSRHDMCRYRLGDYVPIMLRHTNPRLLFSRCRHLYCKECLNHYYVTSINEGDALHIQCPDPRVSSSGYNTGCRLLLRIVV